MAVEIPRFSWQTINYAIIESLRRNSKCSGLEPEALSAGPERPGGLQKLRPDQQKLAESQDHAPHQGRGLLRRPAITEVAGKPEVVVCQRGPQRGEVGLHVFRPERRRALVSFQRR